MKNSVTDDRMAAAFILGCLVFNPPLLGAFDGEGLILGIPVLYVSLFAGWLILIGLMAFIIETRRDQPMAQDGSDAFVDDPHDYPG